jgi:hypothetical protein
MATIAEEAQSLTSGDRHEAYGSANVIFTRLGRIWGAMLNIPDIPPQTVALMLAAHKISRETHRSKRDNRVDIIGYTILSDQCLEEE